MKKYYALYKKQFILGPAFKLAEAILELLVPLVMAKIIDVGIKNGDVPYIIKMGLLMASLGILGLLCAIVCQYSAAVAQQGVGTEIRNDMFKKINSFAQSDIDENYERRKPDTVGRCNVYTSYVSLAVFNSRFAYYGNEA